MKNLKQSVKLMVVVIITISLASCGGGKKEYSIKPSSTAIKGDLSDYFEVVDGTYKLEFEKESKGAGIRNTKIQIKRKDKEFNFDKEMATIELKWQLLEDDQSPVDIDYRWVHNFMGGDLEILSLKPNETAWLIIPWTSCKEDDIKKVKFFSLSSSVENSEPSSSSSAASSVESNTSSDESAANAATSAEKVSSSGSEDWDKMLDDYDEYVTEYIKFYKKAMKGDQSAMSEYPSMMEKATNLSESMQKAQNDNQLSAKQITRMAKIQTKMLKAATSN